MALESYLNMFSSAADKDQDSPTSTGDKVFPLAMASPAQNHSMDISDSDLLAEMSKLTLQESSSFITPKSSVVKKHVFITG